MPASSLVGENMAQPCALTTNVSQISEKGALGSRLVTAMGSVIGTRELRRIVSGTFALCMATLFHGDPLSWCALHELAPLDWWTGSNLCTSTVTQAAPAKGFQ